MAFITLIIGFLALGFLALLLLAGITCLILGIIFHCLSARDKKNGRIPPKWKTQAAMICSIAGGGSLVVIVLILLFIVI